MQNSGEKIQVRVHHLGHIILCIGRFEMLAYSIRYFLTSSFLSNVI